MCQSYRRPCACGQKTAEIFFGNMVLDEAVVSGLYCPACSGTVEVEPERMVEDNGWVLELDPEVLQAFAPRMQMDPDEVTPEKAFDGDYVTWVGFSPEDNVQRSRERAELAQKYQGDVKGQFDAMKQWAIQREKRFVDEGWRKAVRGKAAYA